VELRKKSGVEKVKVELRKETELEEANLAKALRPSQALKERVVDARYHTENRKIH
jgi:hypothetical protein